MFGCKTVDERLKAEQQRKAAETLRRLQSQVASPLEQDGAIIPSESPGRVPLTIGELTAAHYRSAEGYDPLFLGAEHELDLPKLAPHLRPKVAKLKDGGEVLTYHHFSIVMNAERRLAFLTAVNIDVRQLKQVKRNRDNW